MSEKKLEEDLSFIKSLYEDCEASFKTNEAFISNNVDNPAMEHLVDMSIQHTPTEAEMFALKTKINQLENELNKRRK